jgi:hypothetical protein
VNYEEDEAIPQPKTVPAKQPSNKLPHVFLSYRRDDAPAYPGLLKYALTSSIQGINIFRDADTLTPGVIFSDKIDEAVTACDVLIAIIGKKWLGREAETAHIRSLLRMIG